MMTKTGMVARQLIKQSGRGYFVFNDRLVDGRRSLKVWGWNRSDYKEAKRLLELAGCRVDLVGTETYSPRSNQRFLQTRLHVTE